MRQSDLRKIWPAMFVFALLSGGVSVTLLVLVIRALLKYINS